MQRVKLGKSDLEVPVLCLGGNVLRMDPTRGRFLSPARHGA